MNEFNPSNRMATMKRGFKRGMVWLAIGFALLFILRLGYGYLVFPANDASQNDQANNTQSAIMSEKRNYATLKYKSDGGGSALDQKYEKIGSISALTRRFEEDEKKVRELIEENEGVLQSEQAFGLQGNRSLSLAIGVPPVRFDQFMDKARAIGKLSSISVKKLDKTNEYKELAAKRQSLLETKSALAALKGRGGKVDELIKLEDRILETEKEIQGLGIRLGEFDQENEFCTVKFSLSEQAPAKGIPFAQRAKVAFEWTVQFYLMLVIILAFGAVFSLAAAMLVQKLIKMGVFGEIKS